MIAWMCVVAILGVLLAFPLKRRFINDEQLPFPEGRASGVVLDALYTAPRSRRHVQGAAARVDGGLRRTLPVHRQRRLDESAAVQDPAHGPLGGHEGAVDVPRPARHVLLRGGGESEPLHPDDPRHRHPPARAAPHPRRGDARRRRADGHRGRDELPARRVHQFRDPRADHDPGGRHRRPHRSHRRGRADLARGDRQPVVAVVGRDDDGRGLAGEPVRPPGDLQGTLQAQREGRRPRRPEAHRVPAVDLRRRRADLQRAGRMGLPRSSSACLGSSRSSRCRSSSCSR